MEDACDSSTSLGTYSLLLHSYIGRTMLEFQVKHGVCVTESCSFFSHMRHWKCDACDKEGAPCDSQNIFSWTAFKMF